MRKLSVLIFCLFILLIPAFPQGVQTDFGSGTMQYSVHEWRFIHSDNFDAYFYEDGSDLAEYALVQAEKQLKRLENIIDYRLGSRSQILLFHSEYDLRHSNLFQYSHPFNPGGYSYAMQNKVIVAFNGNRQDLARAIRYGISELLVRELMYGGSFQERLQASTLLYLPEWYYKGLLSYLAEPWSTEIDNAVKDELAQGKLERINLLDPEGTRLAGHSWWNYIAENYGKRSISDILYLTRVSKGFENALLFVLGARTGTVFKDWINYYRIRYADDPGTGPDRNAIRLPASFIDKDISQIRLSPNGNMLAIACNKRGRYEIWTLRLYDKKLKRIYHSDETTPYHWNEYEPVLAWNPDSKGIHAFLHEKGSLKHLFLSLNSGKKRAEKLPQLELITWASIHPDGKQFLLSAADKGRSDLFIYTPENGMILNLSQDVFDDEHAVFNENGTGILFSSNRNGVPFAQQRDNRYIVSDSSSFDIYTMAWPSDGKRLKRITNTPFVHEIQPNPYPGGGIAYLTDNNGIFNLYVTLSTTAFDKALVYVDRMDEPGKLLDSFVVHVPIDTHTFKLEDLELDSSFMAKSGAYRVYNRYREVLRHYPLSDYNRNLRFYDVDGELRKDVSMIRYLGRYYIQSLELSGNVEEDARYTTVIPTRYRKETGHQALVSDSGSRSFLVEPSDVGVEKEIVVQKPLDTAEKKERYTFQTGFPEIPAEEMEMPREEKKVQFHTRDLPYRTTFLPDYFVTQLIDNSIINTPYYLNNGFSRTFNTFSRPNLNARLELGFQDLFNDQSIVAGGRIPLRLYSTDFYFHYIQRKYRYDFGTSFFRSTRMIDGATNSHRVLIHEIRPFVSRPLPGNLEVRFSAFYRSDRTVTNATDQISLQEPDEIRAWTGGRIELMLDRKRMEELNFPVGIQAKLYAERFQSLQQNLGVNILGGEFRYYRKLFSKVLWANRLSTGASFGDGLVNYFVGGTENWLSNRYNQELGTNTNYRYTFNTLVSGIRGFQQNVRNGGQFLVLNSEIRVPILDYLLKRPLSFDMLRTLQWVAFYDIGSAWNGFNPFGDQHYNTRQIDQGSVSITIRNKNNPFVSGVGMGLRTRVFGYYIRTDMAWGIENGIVVNNGKPTWHFSLGYDF